MNDSLKEIIKEVIKDFFIITVAMLFVVSLANSIALIEYYPPYFPWVVMGTGAVTSIPRNAKNEPSSTVNDISFTA